MNADPADLLALASSFAVLSFLAIGGVNALIPEIHRIVVDVHGWMPSARFADFFAISQAAPGPNMMVISLIGWTVGGFAGVLVTNLAFLGPTSVLAYVLGRTWYRFRHARWRTAVQHGLLPVTVGLVAASSYVLARSAGDSIGLFILALVAAAVAAATRVHPLIPIAIGGLLGMAGLV